MDKDSTPGAKPRSRNTESLQADLPGKKDRTLEGGSDETSVSKTTAKKQQKQSKAALENVKEGY